MSELGKKSKGSTSSLDPIPKTVKKDRDRDVVMPIIKVNNTVLLICTAKVALPPKFKGDLLRLLATRWSASGREAG